MRPTIYFRTHTRTQYKGQMISSAEYIQLKAYARQDGIFFGILWIIAFACLIHSMQDHSLQFGFIIGAIATPFLAYYRLKHFRDKVLEGHISFRRAFAFVTFTMGYGSIIMAAATYIYFYFLDHGTFIGFLQQSFSTPEVRNSIMQTGVDIQEMEKQIQAMSQIRPIDFAFSVFSNGIISAFFMGIIIGFLGKRQTTPEQI